MFWRRICTSHFARAHLGKLRGLLSSSGFGPDFFTAKGVRTMRGRRGRFLYSTCARSQEHREGEMIDIFCGVSERRREEQNNCQVRFPSNFREVVSSQSHDVRNDKYHEGISEILPRVLMSIKNALAARADLGRRPKINYLMKASWGEICTRSTPFLNWLNNIYFKQGRVQTGIDHHIVDSLISLIRWLVDWKLGRACFFPMAPSKDGERAERLTNTVLIIVVTNWLKTHIRDRLFNKLCKAQVKFR